MTTPRSRETIGRLSADVVVSTDLADSGDLPQRTFVAVLENVGVPSWILDDQGRLDWANKAYIDLYGDRLGEPIDVCFAPPSAGDAGLRLKRLADRKTPAGATANLDVETVAHDGRRVLTQITAVRLQPGTFRGAVFGLTVAKPLVDVAGSSTLTPRQSEVLQLLAGGASTEQIAAALHLSRETVRNHIRNLLRALRATSRLEAIAKARAQGLIVAR